MQETLCARRWLREIDHGDAFDIASPEVSHNCLACDQIFVAISRNHDDLCAARKGKGIFTRSASSDYDCPCTSHGCQISSITWIFWQSSAVGEFFEADLSQALQGSSQHGAACVSDRLWSIPVGVCVRMSDQTRYTARDLSLQAHDAVISLRRPRRAIAEEWMVATTSSMW